MSVQEVIANEAYGTLAAGAGAPTAGTVQNWTMASSNLPSCTSGVTQFRIVDQQAQSEIVLVTVSNGTALTVTRGSEGTTPVVHAVNALFALTVTAGVIANLPYTGPLSAADSSVTVTGGIGASSLSSVPAQYVQRIFAV